MSSQANSVESGQARSDRSHASQRCLYCDKIVTERAREHAIPQFLGGAYAPRRFLLENVCRRCNNDLGLFVDGAFARSWFVTNALALAARKLYCGRGDNPLPLICMGAVTVPGIVLPTGYACECWLGPFGDRIYWIRPHDENLYWYTGGNPIDQKQLPSTAYVLLADGSIEQHAITLDSVLKFFKNKRVRKILAHPGSVSQFDKPSLIDASNLKAILSAHAAKNITSCLALNIDCEARFCAKLALSMGYSLFGNAYLECPTASRARRTCFAKPGESYQLRGSGSTLIPNVATSELGQRFGYPGVVSFTVVQAGNLYALAVSIDQTSPLVLELGAFHLTSPAVDQFGTVLFVVPHLRHSLELPIPVLLAHRTGYMLSPELVMLDARLAASLAFFKKMGHIEH